MEKGHGSPLLHVQQEKWRYNISSKMVKYVTVILVVLLLNHDASMERANICVLFYIHMQILSINHSISTTHVVQPRMLYIIFSSFYKPESFAFLFSVEKPPKPNPPKEKVPTPAAAVCISKGGKGIWWLGFPTVFRDWSIWRMASQIGQVFVCFCYVWFCLWLVLANAWRKVNDGFAINVSTFLGVV